MLALDRSSVTVARSRPDVSIITSGHDVADARIHRLAAALTHDGLVLELLGLGDAALAPPGVATRVHRRPGPIGRALLALRFAAMGRGRVLLALDPDSLLASLVLARLRRRRVVADVHAWAEGARRRRAGASGDRCRPQG